MVRAPHLAHLRVGWKTLVIVACGYGPYGNEVVVGATARLLWCDGEVDRLNRCCAGEVVVDRGAAAKYHNRVT